MKILIIGPSWVGDMMMSQSLYRTLKHLHPHAQIDVLAPAWSFPLLARMPEVSQSIEMPVGHGSVGLGVRYRLGKKLRSENYTHAMVLPNSFKSALIPWFANIPVRIGWRGEMRYGLLTDCRKLHKPSFGKMVERYVALAYPKSKIGSAQDIPQPILLPKLMVSEAEKLATKQRFLSDFDLATSSSINDSKKLIGFCPGAEFGPAKRWPDYHYATLAQKIIQAGHQVVILGSKKDEEIGEKILELVKKQLPAESTNNCLNTAGKTTLDEAMCLIANCDSIVTNDSGLMHVAAALDKPLIALYGPTSPEFTPPLHKDAIVIRLISGYHKIRKGDQQAGYHQSLIDITPQKVWESLSNWL